MSSFSIFRMKITLTCSFLETLRENLIKPFVSVDKTEKYAKHGE